LEEECVFLELLEVSRDKLTEHVLDMVRDLVEIDAQTCFELSTGGWKPGTIRMTGDVVLSNDGVEDLLSIIVQMNDVSRDVLLVVSWKQGRVTRQGLLEERFVQRKARHC